MNKNLSTIILCAMLCVGCLFIESNEFVALAFIGGSVGAILGMLIFRHKIRKPRFVIGVPLFLLMNIGALVLLINILP